MSAFRDGADWLLKVSASQVESYGPAECEGPNGPRVERLVCVQWTHWYILRESGEPDYFDDTACRAVSDQVAFAWLRSRGMPLPLPLQRYSFNPDDVARVGFVIVAEVEDYTPDYDGGAGSQILLRTRDGRWGLAHTWVEPEDLEYDPPEEVRWPLGIEWMNGLDELSPEEADRWCVRHGLSLPADLPMLGPQQLRYLRDVADHPGSKAVTIAGRGRMDVNHDSARKALSALVRLKVISNNRRDGYFVTDLGRRVLKAAESVADHALVTQGDT